MEGITVDGGVGCQKNSNVRSIEKLFENLVAVGSLSAQAIPHSLPVRSERSETATDLGRRSEISGSRTGTGGDRRGEGRGEER